MDPDLTIVLLGKSGVGKSASGNTILGREVFESEVRFTSVTKEISEERGPVFGKQISVVDTPGILESEEQIRTCCQNLLQSNRKCVFLLVFPVGRFTREDQKAVGAASRVLGDQGMKNSFLLFTHGESLKNKSLKDLICELDDGSHPDMMRSFSSASHLFNNGDGDQEQVRDLLLKIENLRTHQQPDPTAAGLQRRIVLLGSSGVGKSSSGNTILGSERFRSAGGFNSVSIECVSESESVDGRLLQVFDTPGFTDEVLNPEQLCEEIMKTLVEASPGPHAFIIVVRIGKISAADQRLLELVPKLFGGDATKYTMVLFTHGDELRGRSMDQLIRSNRCVSDLVSMCDGRYCVFDNTQRGRRLQVRDLLNKIDEMVAGNGEHCTSDMFRMAETFIREERNRAAQSADSNRPDQSADSNRPDQSADSNRPDQSADSNRPDQSDGVNSAPSERSQKRLTPYLKYFSAGGLTGAATGGMIGWLIGVGVGAGIGAVVGAGVGAVVGAGIGLGVDHVIPKSIYTKQSDESSRVAEDEQLSLQTRSREEGGRRLSEEP